MWDACCVLPLMLRLRNLGPTRQQPPPRRCCCCYCCCQAKPNCPHLLKPPGGSAAQVVLGRRDPGIVKDQGHNPTRSASCGPALHFNLGHLFACGLLPGGVTTARCALLTPDDHLAELCPLRVVGAGGYGQGPVANA
jgi:hypothetical protein